MERLGGTSVALHWYNGGFYQSATTQGAEFLTSKRCPEMFTAFMLECKWIHTCHKLLNEFFFTLHLLIAVVTNQLPASQSSSKEDLVAQVKRIFLSKYSKFRCMSCFCLCVVYITFIYFTWQMQYKGKHIVRYHIAAVHCVSQDFLKGYPLATLGICELPIFKELLLQNNRSHLLLVCKCCIHAINTISARNIIFNFHQGKKVVNFLSL